jgi:two-component sensor histidine kinase
MALLHETLYRSADFGRIDFPVYVESLCAYLTRSYGVDTSRVALSVNVAPISLDLDRALPCGLIVNELVSNSLKYAFPAERSGRVAVELRQAEDKSYLLKVSDTGVGLPPEWNEKLATSLGLRLVSDLAKQLRGKLRVGSEGGAHFTITFPPEQVDHHA